MMKLWKYLPLVLVILGAGTFRVWSDYNLTQGSGTPFASKVISTIHHPATLVCDTTNGEANCAAVKAGNTAATTDQAMVVTDANVLAALATATPQGGNRIGFTSDDPCSQATKSGFSINQTANAQLFVGVASKKTYVCALTIMATTAGSVALVEGTGTTCATNTFGLTGGTTAALGLPVPATGGLTIGSGSGTVISPSADTNATAANICLFVSGTGQTSGHITYVQQ